MSQRKICLAQLLVQANGIGAEARLAGREKLGAGGIGAERAIEVIRRAAHHAVRVLRHDRHRAADGREVARPFAAADTNARP